LASRNKEKEDGMKFIVPVRTTTTEIYRVEAENAEEAMNLALEDNDPDYVTCIDLIEGDSECQFRDIYQEKEI